MKKAKKFKELVPLKTKSLRKKKANEWNKAHFQGKPESIPPIN